MQRNKLLKQISFQPSLEDTLDIWDMQLLQYGESIIKRRSQFIEEIGETVTKVNENLTGNKEHLQMLYVPPFLCYVLSKFYKFR